MPETLFDILVGIGVGNTVEDMQERLARSRAKWEALYEALKDMEGREVTKAHAGKALKGVNPKVTVDGALMQMVVFEHKGYIEGVRDADGHMKKRMAVKITQRGHEYFKGMIEETKELAMELA